MLAPGTQVEGYVVGCLLGEGGTASVYAVRHGLLDTWHALKVLHRSDADTRARLLREGRVQSRLDPGLIVPVTDVLLADGAPALVLPLVRGMSLDTLLEPGKPSPNEAIDLFAAICRSVAHAHAHGVVHRDLKPANVLVDADAGFLRLRVADFGLVRAIHEDSDAGAQDGTRTSRGSMMGSPAYAAPEQLADAARADQRADVWSLGVILYELLTGNRPFNADSLRELIALVMAGRVDMQPVPAAYREAVAGLLHPDPRERPADASHVLAGLPAAGAVALNSPFGARLVIPDLPAPPQVRSIAPSSASTETYAVEPSPTLPLAGAHLPAERSPLFGRVDEGAQLRDALADGARLTTLSGIGGTGKTRLVIAVGWQVVQDWPGGVWFCDLTEARDLAGVAEALANTLGVVITAGDPVKRVTEALLSRGRCLVILDNFEQVVEHGPATLGRWLDGAHEAAFIVTSREVLGLRGERVLPLAPLSPNAAFDLFMARARAVRPDFEPDSADTRAIHDLLAMIDHLPLAIELAAARIRTLSPPRMLQRMDDRFRLLTTRGRSDKASTLRATLDWSWELLSPAERETFAQLSVFEGGFTLDAAERVVKPSDSEAWVLDTVEALVDKSILRTLPHERFGMLVSVHAYARERRDELEDADAAARRHAVYFAEFGTLQALRSLSATRGIRRQQALNRELDNLRAVLRRTSDGAIAAATALAAWAVYIVKGPFETGLSVLQKTLERSDIPDPRRVDLLRAVGVAHHQLGDFAGASDFANRALTLATTLGDGPRQAQVLLALTLSQRGLGHLEEALATCARSLALCSGGDLEYERSITLANKGVVLQIRGKLDEAESAFREALDICRTQGNERQVGLILGNLGTLAGRQGRMDEAGVRFKEALTIAQGLEATRTETFLTINLGIVASRQGRHSEAQNRFAAALAKAKIMGERSQQAACLSYLGAAHSDRGDVEAARDVFEELLKLADSLDSPRRKGAAHGGLGTLHRLAGRYAEAQEHLHAALGYHQQAGFAPRVPEWHLKLGLLAIDTGDFEAAEAHLLRASEAAAPFPPVVAEVWLGRARLALARGQTDAAWQAIVHARHTGVQDRTRALLHAVEAMAHRANGDISACEQAIDAALAHPAWTHTGTEVRGLIEATRP